MREQGLYRFTWVIRRMGTVESIFVYPVDKVAKLVGKRAYFGEILGKHSEVDGTVEENDIALLSDDQDFVSKFVDIMGPVVGHDLLGAIACAEEQDEDYDRDEEDEEEDEEEGEAQDA